MLAKPNCRQYEKQSVTQWGDQILTDFAVSALPDSLP